MERLTGERGLICQYDGCIYKDDDFDGCENCHIFIEAINRLQAYEDTGLLPEEIPRAKGESMSMIKNIQ